MPRCFQIYRASSRFPGQSGIVVTRSDMLWFVNNYEDLAAMLVDVDRPTICQTCKNGLAFVPLLIADSGYVRIARTSAVDRFVLVTFFVCVIHMRILV